MKKKNKRLVCADGFSMSIQANNGAYCSPRNDEGPYHEVEIGYPNMVEFLILPYAEDELNPSNTVYSYVPSEIVLEVILKHGGFIDGELPRMEMGLSKNYMEWK